MIVQQVCKCGDVIVLKQVLCLLVLGYPPLVSGPYFNRGRCGRFRVFA